jgi:hypothetical protein
MATNLANKAFVYLVITTDKTTPPANQDPFTYNTNISRYTADNFYSIMINIGASQHSTAGYGQFLVLQRLDTNIQLNTATQGIVNVQFRIGSTSSIRLAKVGTPIGTIKFHIVKVDTPLLLYLVDMD